MYKPRLFLKNVFSGSNTFCNTSVPYKFSINKALVVSKLSIYEFEKYRNKDLTENELEAKLRARGTDYERIYHAHTLHKKYEKNIFNTLKGMGIDVRVVNRLSYNEECVKWADVIIPTGGDGTFLLAASKVHDNVLPVIGFNSDPSRSEGYLCLPKQYSTNVEKAIQRILSGNFRWLLRSRIRVTLAGHKADVTPTQLHEIQNDMELRPAVDKEKGRILPYLALNEVFIGEKISARVSHLDLWLNEQLYQTSFKCSGLCVSTGTGSTSWHLSINRLPVQTVADLLRLFDREYEDSDYSLAKKIADTYNNNLLFSPTERSMAYTIRDLISAGVWPKPKGIKSSAFATRIKVKSKCFDACLVIDGGVSFAFNDGTVALLQIYPEDALRTVQFVD